MAHGGEGAAAAAGRPQAAGRGDPGAAALRRPRGPSRRPSRSARTRVAVVASIRQSLMRRGYLEIETPMLQTLHGGAAARPFVTHSNAFDLDVYLRIAPGALPQAGGRRRPGAGVRGQSQLPQRRRRPHALARVHDARVLPGLRGLPGGGDHHPRAHPGGCAGRLWLAGRHAPRRLRPRPLWRVAAGGPLRLAVSSPRRAHRAGHVEGPTGGAVRTRWHRVPSDRGAREAGGGAVRASCRPDVPRAHVRHGLPRRHVAPGSGASHEAGRGGEVGPVRQRGRDRYRLLRARGPRRPARAAGRAGGAG